MTSVRSMQAAIRSFLRSITTTRRSRVTRPIRQTSPSLNAWSRSCWPKNI